MSQLIEHDTTLEEVPASQGLDVEHPPLDRAIPRVRREPKSRELGSKPRTKYFTPWLCLVAAPILHAIPWLVDGAPWCGVIAIATGLYLATRQSVAASFWLMWLWSTIAIGAAFYWSPSAMAYTLSSGIVLGTVVALPLILWDGLRLALGYWLAARITKDVRAIWLPAALTTMAMEFLLPSVFPWRLGFMVLPWMWFTQAVDVFGPAWPTFVAFAAAGMLISVIAWITKWILADRRTSSRGAYTQELDVTSDSHSLWQQPLTALASPTDRWARRAAWGSAIVIALNLLYGYWSSGYWQNQIDAASKIRVALVQVDPSFTVSLGQAQELTTAVKDDVDLVCWPESSGGNYELALDALDDEERVFMSSRAPERGMRPWPKPTCELLLGGKNYVGDPEAPDQLYVTAMLIDSKERITARYNKRFLMPFGEYVPMENTVPGLAELFDMAEHMTPGEKAEVLKSQTGARLGTMLCYEDMVPAAAREMSHSGANLLVSLINGSAFESPHTLKQHRLLSQLRALECRRYFLRCAATGETCVISPLGEIVERIPVQCNETLKAEVALLDRTTVYSHIPWATPAMCFLGLAIQVAVPWQRRRKAASAKL